MQTTLPTIQYATRPSIGTAMQSRLARAVEHGDPKRGLRGLARAVVAIIGCLLVAAPQHVFGVLYASATWNGSVLMKIAAVLLTVSYFHVISKLYSKLRAHMRTSDPDGNQHTYFGIPIEQIADYLIENQGFQREHAIKYFGISRKRQFKIADELEKHSILERGRDNARFLNKKITREQLVRQLRDKFPLAWSESTQEWGERKGAFETWIMKKDRDEQQKHARAARLERKVDRLQRQREDLESAPGFWSRELTAV